MRINTSMPESLRPYFAEEIHQYREKLDAGQLQLAWHHLERAHIIGQQYPIAHSYAHWKMLKFGFKIKSPKEIAGQIPRLLVGGVKSFVGTVPVGNPGGANVPPMKPFPIATGLQEILNKA